MGASETRGRLAKRSMNLINHSSPPRKLDAKLRHLLREVALTTVRLPVEH